jgi:hypothetical protein
MKRHNPSELKPPKKPALFPFDKNGNAIYDHLTTDADWEKYWKDLKRYKKKLKAKKEREDSDDLANDQGRYETGI